MSLDRYWIEIHTEVTLIIVTIVDDYRPLHIHSIYKEGLDTDYSGAMLIAVL